MRRAEVVTALAVSLVACTAANGWSQAAETKDAPAVAVVGKATGPVRLWEAPEVVLYDNGPLVTHPGVCSAGADASRLQTALGLTSFGFTASIPAAIRIADDFTIPAGPSWTVNQITFFGYQTGSTTTPTFNDARVQIWDGPPNVGTSVLVFGDTTTNRFASAAFSNIYRDLDTATCPAAQTRPIMAVTANVGTTLAPGTYWVDFMLGGTLASGPFIPPLSILGQTDGCPGLCNALQFNAAWVNMADGATQQDVRFIVDGTIVPVELMSFEVN